MKKLMLLLVAVTISASTTFAQVVSNSLSSKHVKKEIQKETKHPKKVVKSNNKNTNTVKNNSNKNAKTK